MRNMFATLPLLRFALCLCPIALVGVTRSAGAEPDFLRDVRPILSTHCFKCHGPDESARKAGLRLDVREDAAKGGKSGKPAFVPGEPDKSELVRRIKTKDEDDLMPPPATKLPLTDAQKEILTEWVQAGAKYKPHWAFAAPVQSALPKVQKTSWPRNEIDYFVLSRLEHENLSPSPVADKYTLIRRIYLDLTGLPPTPKQVEAFVKDTSPNAYETVVDDLLASPHYGERWARRWLDLARYADTNGYEKDRQRSIWPYRDWVIRAFNSDMPFDEFTVEQIAGDMLPHATANDIVATGFHRNSMLNEEGGIDPLEYRFYAMVDRVHVTATTWLGLTMACAQCHTHKFDPIQHREYYQFMAFLNNADEPIYEVPNREIQEKRKSIQARINKLEAGLIDRFPAEPTIEWTTPATVEFASAAGADGEHLEDGSIRVSGKRPDKDNYTLRFETTPKRITHVQLEAIPDDKFGGPGRTDHGNFVLTKLEMEGSRGAENQKLKFSSAEADYSQNGFSAEQAISGEDKGWAVAADANTRTHRRAIFTLAEPFTNSTEAITIRLIQQYGDKHTLGRFRVSFGNDISNASTLAERQVEARDRKFAKWLEREKTKLVHWQALRPSAATSDVPNLTIEADGAVFASGDFTKQDIYRLKFTGVPAGVRALRIEALPDDRLPGRGPGIVYYEGERGDFFLSTLSVTNGGRRVALRKATESYAKDENSASKAIDEDQQSGWSIAGAQGKPQNAVFQFSEPSSSDELEMSMIFERYYASALGKFRVWVTTDENAVASGLPDEEYDVLLKYRTSENVARDLTGSDRKDLLEQFGRVAPELGNARKEIDELRASMPKLPTTLVMRERNFPRTTHRHHRGEFLQSKEEVQPDVPSFLPPLPSGAPKNRLGFARWLVSRENPLTARVTVNRDWEAFFGRGIVRTTEDFGFQGELPSHPELLDWLAVEFMRQGWSLKKLHKLIVMSATYQQSSVVTPELHQRDPLNILLARGPRVRLEAELVRDCALAEAGLLSEKIGGPSVFPPQPPGVTTEGAYGALQWKVSDGGDRYRRGLYTFMKRTAPYAMTLTFDGPSGEACLARRDRSNTPLQALTVLNDDVFVQCANALGQWAAQQRGDPARVMQELFERCVSRPPTDEEGSKLCNFYTAQLERFKRGELKAEDLVGGEKSDSAEGQSERAAWAAVARVLLNLDETIMKS